MRDVVTLDDGDLPEVDGATAFHVGRAADGFEVWAARIDGAHARTYVVAARRLSVRASDAAVARLLGFDPDAPPSDVEWRWLEPRVAAAAAADVVCTCRGITRAEVEAAIAAGWRSVDAVKRATKAAFGECQARGCAAAIAAMMRLAEDDPRAGVTPRPPLVPVPASVLGAFVPEVADLPVVAPDTR